MLNLVALKYDGRAVTGQSDTEGDAFLTLKRWMNDPFYTDGKPMARFFIGDIHGVREFTSHEVRAYASMSKHVKEQFGEVRS